MNTLKLEYFIVETKRHKKQHVSVREAYRDEC